MKPALYAVTSLTITSLTTACTPLEAEVQPREPGDVAATETGATEAPGPTGSTGDTAAETTGAPFDCSALPSGPFQVTTYDIRTSEDFDFDALGNLVTHADDAAFFVAVDIDGNRSQIGPGPLDTRGLQILSDGNIASVHMHDDSLRITDRQTGALLSLVPDVATPNPLDVGDGDVLYVGTNAPYDAQVISYDPATGERVEIGSGMSYVLGVALDQDQDTLYFADSAFGVYRVERDPSGAWGPQELLFAPSQTSFENYDGLETDICGNLYLIEYKSGALYRFDPKTDETELLLTISGRDNYWNALRWGSGRGGWRRDVLYATNRHQVHGIEIGVPGRSQPVDQMP